MINSGDKEEESPPRREEAGGEAPAEPPYTDFSGSEGAGTQPSDFHEVPPQGTSLPSPADSPDEAALNATLPGSVLTPELEESRQSEASKEMARSRRSRWGVYLRELVETALLALLIFLAVRASLQNFRVEGSSMVPSLDSGQQLIVNKLAYATIDLGNFDWVPFLDPGQDQVHYLFGGPDRGDVIVFHAPQNPGRDFIKRVIGMSGDHVQILGDRIYLNDELLVEPYAQSPTLCNGQFCDVIVPEGQLYVLGDNRPASSDSRAFGLVPEDSVVGKAFFSYWPLEDAGLAPNHSISYASDEE